MLANTIQNEDCEIDKFVETLTEPFCKEGQYGDDYENIDLFAPLEILECQSMIDYLSTSPNILIKIIKDQHRGKKNYSLLGQLINQVDSDK